MRRGRPPPGTLAPPLPARVEVVVCSRQARRGAGTVVARTPPGPPPATLRAQGAAALGGLLHLLGKRGPVAALEGELPPLQPQALAAARARARAPALHPRQGARGLADGIAPLDLVKVPDRVPPALGLWMGQTPRESLRAYPWPTAAPGEAGRDGGGGEGGEGRSWSAQTPPLFPASSVPAPLSTCTCTGPPSRPQCGRPVRRNPAAAGAGPVARQGGHLLNRDGQACYRDGLGDPEELGP